MPGTRLTPGTRRAVSAAALVLIALLPGPCGPAAAETQAQAASPPLWANLAECSAVFAAVSRTDEHSSGADPAGLARAAALSDAFLAKAEEAAGEAGQADPEADVASIMDYLRPRWENRIGKLFSVPSNLRWIDYCGDLGRAEGVLPPAN